MGEERRRGGKRTCCVCVTSKSAIFFASLWPEADMGGEGRLGVTLYAPRFFKYSSALEYANM